MAGLWAVVLLLMIVPSCEAVDLDTIAREISGGITQLRCFDNAKGINPNVKETELPKNGSVRPFMEFGLQQQEELYRYFTDEKDKHFIDQMLKFYYHKKSGNVSESELKHRAVEEFLQYTFLDTLYNTKDVFLAGRLSEAVFNFLWDKKPSVDIETIVSEVTGYIKQFLEKYVHITAPKVYLSISEPLMKINRSELGRAYRDLSNDGKDFIDLVLNCFYFKTHGVFTAEKLKQSINYQYVLLSLSDWNTILGRVSPAVQDFLVNFNRNVDFETIVAEITEFSIDFLKDYMKNHATWDRLRLDYRLGFNFGDFKESYKELSGKAGKRFVYTALLSACLSKRETYSKNVLKKSINVEFQKLDNNDKAIILKRVSEEVKDLLVD